MSKKPKKATVKPDELPRFINSLMLAIQGRYQANPIDILIDKKNTTERTIFPNYPFVAKNQALRLIAEKHPELKESWGSWADLEEHAMISYKGQGREQYVKGLQKQQEQQPTVNIQQPSQPPVQPKKSWKERILGAPKEADEFEQ